MAGKEITTEHGTTVSLEKSGAETLVVLSNPAAPEEFRRTEAGRIIDGGFQPAPFSAWAVRPEALRAIADLMEGA